MEEINKLEFMRKELLLNIEHELTLLGKIDAIIERWSKIEGYDNYSVSTFGRVRNDTTKRILKFGYDGGGYNFVNLSHHGVIKIRRIHRLVAVAFLANLSNKHCVDHIDNQKINNHITNLRYATHQENNRNCTIRKDNQLGVKGVYYNKRHNKYISQIRIDGIKIYLGCYNTLEEAKQARIKRAKLAFGEFYHTD